MKGERKLYLFGDQTCDVHSDLKDLLRCRNNLALNDFLTKAYHAITTEIFNLRREIRDSLPRLTCIEDLVVQEHRDRGCIAFGMAVTCMYQLGAFIRQADSDKLSNDNNACVLGLSTGALAAAVISCSASVFELVPMAVDAVTVAFRIGLVVTSTAQRFEPSDVLDQSWSLIVPGHVSIEAVHEFCDQTELPFVRKPYISAYAPHGATVSGPPSSLAKLTDSRSLKGLKRIETYGPYHAPHLHSQDDVDEIILSLVPYGALRCLVQMPNFSCPGTETENGNFKTSLRAAVEHILRQPIRWDENVNRLQSFLQSAGCKTFSIAPIGTQADKAIYAMLEQKSMGVPLSFAPLQSNAPASEDVRHSSSARPKLAIIGMSGRFPGAKTDEAFWDLLYQGLDVHKPAPASRWDTTTHVDPTATKKNTGATPFGCWLENPDEFDARFFNVSPREAPQIDPAQRLALMTTYEAIEQAGIVPDATPSTRRDRVGVFYGVSSNDWMETNTAQDVDTYFIPGGNRAFIPGRINYFFNFSGPSFAVDTACSSSLASIHLSCNALWQGDVDTAIAGGTNVLTNPDFTAGLDRGHFLSRTGNCKTFDDSADGYCRGEGIGTIVIKRLDDAIADNDPIIGTILGAWTNHSAESESITRPHVGAQRAVFNKILSQGGAEAQSVSYIEMHGTGTQCGDAGEMASVLEVFAPSTGHSRSRKTDEPLFLGSAKANIGHGEAASGVSSLIKVLLMLQKNTIVPHCGITTELNRKFPTDLRERNVNIALKPTPWESQTNPAKPRRAFVNNFSAAGGNSALLIEDAPSKCSYLDETIEQRSHHLIAISAKNRTSLQGNLKSMIDFLKRNPGIPLNKLSYTTTARRVHHQHRVIVQGSNVGEVCTQFEEVVSEQGAMTRPKSAPKIVFTFTGQGAQYPGMGRQLFENFSLFRSEVRRLNHVGQMMGFPSLLPVIQSEERDVSKFSPTAVQLANVCLQIALSKLWLSWNIVPSAVVGHSLGEYAALNVAGVLSDVDTVYIVGKRGQILEQKCTRGTHGMLVVKSSVCGIASVLKHNTYEIACMNSPIETVLAGSNEEVSRFMELLTDAGLSSKLLTVPYAFHSSQIDPALADLRKLAAEVTYSKVKIPVLCPLDGSIISCNGKCGPDYVARQSREPVDMLKILLAARRDRVITDQTTFLEIGPHPVVSRMARATLGSQISCVPSLQRGRPTWQVLTAALKHLYTVGAVIHWSDYHRDFKMSHEVIELPAYSWDLKRYWIQYRNDWSLRKGEPPLTVSNACKLESTTIHRIVEERNDSQQALIIVESDIAREDLSPLVQGHEVDGIPLCTPSIYADIALSVGTYLLRRFYPNQVGSLVDVTDMAISKALILRAGATQQLLQAHADVYWSSNSASIKFMSFDNQQNLQEHSRCVIRFRNRNLLQTLQKDAAKTKQQIHDLRDGVAAGVTARFNRPMVYRAIRPLARFHDNYRAIDEIVLNSKTLEASSRLSFGSVNRSGDFHTHPAIIDALTQSCGFAMNCNDSTDLDVEVFMNHGWGSLQIFEAFDFDKEYNTHTQMFEGADKLWYGDVTVFDGEIIVAHFGQIAIQGVPRRVLKAILSMEGGSKPQQQQNAQKKGLDPIMPTSSTGATNNPAPVSEERPTSIIAQAMSIIAAESGVALTDLTDSTAFADVGIDSLLGLTISGRFKEELDIDLDFNALFYECPTVVELKTLLKESEISATSPSTNTSSDSSSTPTSSVSGVDASATEDDSPAFKVNFQHVLRIISEESGVASDDLTDDTNFADSGIDSLLSLVVVSRLRDELNLDIQHESVFLECPTVADLKQLLLSHTNANSTAHPSEGLKAVPAPAVQTAKRTTAKLSTPLTTERDNVTLAARKNAVDDYVQEYTAEFSVPILTHTNAGSSDDIPPVVMVTGATGNLGGHLVNHIAQLPDVKTVVCLNRQNDSEPSNRQQKAMRDKGIRFSDTLSSKLLVLQTDSSKGMLGLSSSEYQGLVSSVTHLVHNAWPMSAKRPLAGFESQFRAMRNLIRFAYDAVSQRPKGFKFSFQMVSSIGVVGHYGLDNDDGVTTVPEERVSIESVLPNGYGDAKWGCERMLDETLHKHPGRFRTMAVRLGQIAGSKTSGYWNPMEHFGFLLKSSQTLNALPDVDGTLHWTAVNDVAAALSDLVLSDRTPHAIYHIENPVGQPWREMNAILADALGIESLVPFDEWIERVRAAPQRNNPAAMLLNFLGSNYLRMSCGGLVLGTCRTVKHSEALAAVGAVSEEMVRKYVHVWKEMGFLT
ncbi:MAG: Type I Iterative PKS [Alyxoria varia]|nr:MAG: Type I Iterative PKS [Alyxoria varia]